MNTFKFTHYNEDLGHTPIENIFINHYMPNAPGDYVKIYLLGQKCAYSKINSQLSNETIAKTIGVEVDNVKRAWEYWQSQGIININTGTNDEYSSIEFLSIKEIMLNIKGDDNSNDSYDEPENDDKNKYRGERIVKAAQTNKMKDMFDYIRKISGRELSQNEIFTYLDWIDDYGFPPELVIMLIEDCYSRDKRDMPYLKQVARNWFDANINSLERAEEYAKQHKEKWQKYRRVLNYLRIDRQPTKVEEEMLYRWFYEYSFSDEIVLKACEMTAKTIKPSFSYINATLTDWNQRGFKTIQEVEGYLIKTNKNYKKTKGSPQRNDFNNFASRTYDADQLKQQLLKKSRGDSFD